MSEFDVEHEPYLPIEVIILEGLDAAVYKGWITIREKMDWLDSYNATRNAPVIQLPNCVQDGNTLPDTTGRLGPGF